ncbi:uncharacterized protein PG986_004616 [Apiospora aurea]|uniref:RING-type domain-containing protein n=1 Tax=Apiospora aurea TaxID=335848 RepID=A0ABR1QN42_9PEZI
MSSPPTFVEHNGSPPGHQTIRIIAVAVSVSLIVVSLFAIILFGYRMKSSRQPPRRQRAVPARKVRPEQALGQKAVDHIPIIKYQADTLSPPLPLHHKKSSHSLWPGTNQTAQPREALSTRLWHMISWRRPNDDEEVEDEKWRPSACSICTEDFHTGDKLRKLPCGHLFHPACLDPWLCEQSRTCPLWYVWTLPK